MTSVRPATSRPLHHRPAAYLAVGCGGAVGSGVRFWLTGLAEGVEAVIAVTVGINLGGALALGVLLGWIAQRPGHGGLPIGHLMAGTGVLGGFTTYSAFSVHTLQLLERGAVLWALGQVAASLVLGMLTAVAGLLLGGRLGRASRPAPREERST